MNDKEEILKAIELLTTRVEYLELQVSDANERLQEIQQRQGRATRSPTGETEQEGSLILDIEDQSERTLTRRSVGLDSILTNNSEQGPQPNSIRRKFSLKRIPKYLASKAPRKYSPGDRIKIRNPNHHLGQSSTGIVTGSDSRGFITIKLDSGHSTSRDVKNLIIPRNRSNKRKSRST